MLSYYKTPKIKKKPLVVVKEINYYISNTTGYFLMRLFRNKLFLFKSNTISDLLVFGVKDRHVVSERLHQEIHTPEIICDFSKAYFDILITS